mgnify:FL=1
MNEKKDNLQQLLNKLKKNVTQIGSIGEVKKRYPKAFNNLMLQIKSATSEVYKEYILSALYPMNALSASEQAKMQEQIQGILKRPEMKELASKIFITVLSSYNADDVYAMGSCAYVTILDEVYKSYWLKHIQLRDGQYYSDLLDMWYEPSSSTWTNGTEWSFLYPPTKEEFEADIAPALAVCDRYLVKPVADSAMVQVAV